MSAVIIVLAILAFYFYRKAKNPNAYDEFSEDQLFKRLWYLPIVQLVVCLVVFFLGYVGVQICMQQSPWLADAVRDNFGMFGTIGAELINQNLQDNLAPVLVQADRLHGWSQYLLYATIISLGLQVFALKEKKVSMEIILVITGIISVAAIYLAYQIACTMDLAMNVVLSNETLGLLSNYPGHAIEQGLDCAGILFIILTIYHYGHYNYLARYYGEPVKNINPMARFVKEPQTHLTVGLKSEEHSTEDTKRCPYCGEEILTVAKKCKHCGQWLEGKEKADIPVPTVEPSGEVNKNNDTKSPDKNKKNKWAIAAVLAVLLFGGYFYYNKVDSANRAEAALKLHQDSVAVFKKNAIEIKTYAKAIRKLSYLVFFDYYYNWRTAIFNNYAYNSNNKRTGCNDFNKALAWRESFYEDQGVLKHLKTWQDEMTEKMRVCSVPPEEKHRVTLESLNDLYGKANETVNFCLNPKGNLRTFSDRYESLLQALDNSLSSSDVYINNIDEEADNLYESAISWDINEYINNVLAK